MKKFIFVGLLIAAFPPCWSGEAIASFHTTASNKTYFINSNFKSSWYEAYIDCTFKGMSLLTTDTEEKRAEVVELIKSDKFLKPAEAHIWIGAIGNDRHFTWISTGNPMVYDASHWAPNNPDNYQSLENCVHTYGAMAHYNDRKCSDKLGYVCEERQRNPMVQNSIKYKQVILNIGNRN